MSLNLAIVGHGKMGKLIERLAPEYGFEVRARFASGDNLHAKGLSHETLRGIDVAVEFTKPEAAPENIRRLAVLGVNAVVGTTGWFDNLAAAREAVAHAKTGLVWAPNFSVGMNIFLQTVARAAAAFCETSGIRSVGLGNSSFHQEGRAIGHAEETRGRDAGRGIRTSREPQLESRRSGSRERMKSVSIPPPTRSRCATRRAAAKVLPEARCKRRDGSWGKKDFLSSRTYLGELSEEHSQRGAESSFQRV